MFSLKIKLKYSFFIISCLLLILLSSVRGKPVYGKLDFLLVTNMPWWPSWRPMVEYALKSENKPIFSDILTGGVLNGVFGQQTVYSTKGFRPRRLFIEKLDILAAPPFRGLPVGALSLLLANTKTEKQWLTNHIVEYIILAREIEREKSDSFASDASYRCIVNIQGFQPTWVPSETRHWSPRMASTKRYYRYNFVPSTELESELKENPPRNCFVF